MEAIRVLAALMTSRPALLKHATELGPRLPLERSAVELKVVENFMSRGKKNRPLENTEEQIFAIVQNEIARLREDAAAAWLKVDTDAELSLVEGFDHARKTSEPSCDPRGTNADLEMEPLLHDLRLFSRM